MIYLNDFINLKPCSTWKILFILLFVIQVLTFVSTYHFLGRTQYSKPLQRKAMNPEKKRIIKNLMDIYDVKPAMLSTLLRDVILDANDTIQAIYDETLKASSAYSISNNKMNKSSSLPHFTVGSNIYAYGEKMKINLCMTLSPRIDSGTGMTYDYVSSTLELYKQEFLGDPHFFEGYRFKIFVMNTNPNENKVFENVKAKYANDATGIFIFFDHPDAEWVDPSDFEPDPLDNPSAKPGKQARKQTHDLITLLEHCNDHDLKDAKVQQNASRSQPQYSNDGYTIIVEDDFFPCPYSLKGIFRLLHDVHLCQKDPNRIMGVKFSHGMNGVALRNAIIHRFVEELRLNIDEKACDVMFGVQMFEDKLFLEYRYHLFQHMGGTSSFSFRNTRVFLSKFIQSRAPRPCYWPRYTHELLVDKNPMKLDHIPADEKTVYQSTHFPLSSSLYPCNNKEESKWENYDRLKSDLTHIYGIELKEFKRVYKKKRKPNAAVIGFILLFIFLIISLIVGVSMCTDDDDECCGDDGEESDDDM